MCQCDLTLWWQSSPEMIPELQSVSLCVFRLRGTYYHTRISLWLAPMQLIVSQWPCPSWSTCMNSPHWMSNAIVIPRHVSWNPEIDDWFSRDPTLPEISYTLSEIAWNLCWNPEILPEILKPIGFPYSCSVNWADFVLQLWGYHSAIPSDSVEALYPFHRVCNVRSGSTCPSSSWVEDLAEMFQDQLFWDLKGKRLDFLC